MVIRYILVVQLLTWSLCFGAQFKEASSLFEGTYSERFIMRWYFQDMCHHVYDMRTNPYVWPSRSEGTSFDPRRVKKGDLIFVRDVHRFMQVMHPRIKQPYIMITAGERRDQVTQEHMAYLDDDNLIAWFAVHNNCYKTHQKFYPLPLGLYQDPQFFKPDLSHFYAGLRAAPKDKLLYSNFGDLSGMKPERADVVRFFEDKDYCFTVDIRNNRLPFLDYMKQMSEFKFSLSPRGYGPDTYRTWEALMVGSIPIVHISQLDDLYAGLPILLIDDWTCLTKEFLEKKYQEMTSEKWPIDKLFMEYWERKILSVRKEYLKK